MRVNQVKQNCSILRDNVEVFQNFRGVDAAYQEVYKVICGIITVSESNRRHQGGMALGTTDNFQLNIFRLLVSYVKRFYI